MEMSAYKLLEDVQRRSNRKIMKIIFLMVLILFDDNLVSNYKAYARKTYLLKEQISNGKL